MEPITEQSVFLEYLRLKGYVMHIVPNTRNCFYQSLSEALFPDEDGHVHQKEIRKSVHSYITAHYDEYEAYYPCLATTPTEIRNERLAEMKKILLDDEWADEHMIAAASKHFNVAIVVELPGQMKQVYCTESDATTTVYLSFHDGYHYNWLDYRADLKSTDHYAVSLYFNAYLQLRKYEILRTPNDELSMFASLCLARGKAVNMAVQEKGLLLEHLTENFDMFFKDTSAIVGQHPTEKLDVIFKRYLDIVVEDNWRGDNIMLKVASHLYKVPIVLEQPMEEPLKIQLDGQDGNSTIYLSKHVNNQFDLLKLLPDADMEDAEWSLIPFVVEPGTTQYKEKLALIRRSIYSKAVGSVTVVFLVPGENRHYKTLRDAMDNLSRQRLDHMKYMVIYDPAIKATLLRDIDVYKNYTIYSRTLGARPSMQFYSRQKYMAHLMLTPILLNLERCTVEGINVEPMFNSRQQSTVHLLLEHCWSYMKEDIQKEVDMMGKSNNSILCSGCSKSCPLKDVVSHFDPGMFFKEDFKTNRDLCGFLTKFAFFRNRQQDVSPITGEIDRLYHTPAENRIAKFYEFMDKRNTSKKIFSTYVLLHVDGPNMDQYKNCEIGSLEYYAMLLNKDTIKSIYVGSTTNSLVRPGHFSKKRSSVNAIFTQSSRLFLLRSRAFQKDEDARRDEAIVIQYVTEKMRWVHGKPHDPNILVLNKVGEFGKLLPEVLTAHDELCAQYCAGNIPIFKVDRESKEEFQDGPFTGNYVPVVELPINFKTYQDHKFTHVQYTYHRIRRYQKS